MRLLSETQTPTRKRSPQEWLTLFEKIPLGKALVTSNREFGVQEVELQIMVRKLQKKGKLPRNYYTVRKQGVLYIVNGQEVQG